MAARKQTKIKPKQFLQELKAGEKPAFGYLFLGAEIFFRDRCRKGLKKAVLGDDVTEDGLLLIDLKEQSLTRVLDETRSLSLFASSRLIFVSNAENALPAGRSAKDAPNAAALAAYFKTPLLASSWRSSVRSSMRATVTTRPSWIVSHSSTPRCP
ncbi:MAG: hypothetical protein R2748_28180 [Bryobacterales bacterium]